MTSGAHTIDGNANLKAQIDSEGPGLSFGYFEILLACIVIVIIASFWENSLLLGKFDLFWPPVTSILTSSKNDPYVFCSTLHGLSNAVYRFSMRCVVLEISGGGAEITPPPAGSRLAQTPAGARVNAGLTSFLTGHYSRLAYASCSFVCNIYLRFAWWGIPHYSHAAQVIAC